MSFLSHQIAHTLYALKRLYGGIIDVYDITASSVEPKTGVVSVSKTVTHIERAVILPVKTLRELPAKATTQAARFAVSGLYDAGRRLFLVDSEDLSSVSEDNYIVHNNVKYQIESIEQTETGWSIVAKALPGEVPLQIYQVHAEHSLTMAGVNNVE